MIGVSIDSQFTHLAWKNTPIKEGGTDPSAIPWLPTPKHDICRAYDVELEAAGVALRGSS